MVVAIYFNQFVFLRMRQNIGNITHVEKFFSSIFAYRQLGATYRVLTQIFALIDKIVEYRGFVIYKSIFESTFAYFNRATVRAR